MTTQPVVLETARLRLEVLPHGLTFHELVLKPADDDITAPPRHLLVGPADARDHVKRRQFLNTAVGPYANRVPAGSQLLRSTDVPLVLPDKDATGVCLHSGDQGLDVVEWCLIPPDEASLFSSAEVTSSTRLFAYDAPASTKGFPGRVRYEALIGLFDETGTPPRVRYNLRARSKLLTPMNLTIHWGFRLDDSASAEKEDSILEHTLWLKGHQKTATDDKALPTGEIDDLALDDPLNFGQGRADDLRSHRRIRGPDNFVIDHNLLLDKHEVDDPVAVLSSPDQSISLRFRTNQSAVQTYTAAGFDGSGSRKSSHRVSTGQGYNAFGCIFLEFHHPLATFQHDKLQQHAETDTVLHPGQVYDNFVEVEIVTNSSSSAAAAFAALVYQTYEHLVQQHPDLLSGRVLPARHVQFWRDSNKTAMIWEDFLLASYLKHLWKLLYPTKHAPTQFVDVGCGNGILVRLLLRMGYKGYGIDRQARAGWPEELRGDTFRMVDRSPSELFHDEDFAPGTFFIGNHADQLTPWIPFLASKTPDSQYINIPCCHYDLAGEKCYALSDEPLPKWSTPAVALPCLERVLSGVGTPTSPAEKYQQYLAHLGRVAGFSTYVDTLRRPATGNRAMVGIRAFEAGVAASTFLARAGFVGGESAAG